MAQSITLQTSDSDIVSSDVLGRLSFAASSESSGSDAVLIGASIYAMAESNFTEISNATSIIFATASSESAIAKLKISSQGHFLPILDKTYDIGASGTKFRNVFAENGKFENISISNLSDPYEILYITDSSGNVSSTDLLKVDVANTEIDLGGDLIPTSNLAYDLGSSSYKFRDTYTDKVILNSGSAIPATISNTVYNVSGELYYNNNVVALLPSGGVQGQILQKYSTTSNILEWIDNFATEVRVYVKNTTGSALTKGQAVYINGAQGDHPTIALAIADGESSSSKTLGLLKQNLAINEFGYVIAEGGLDGIDTSAASAAGDLVYLSPTTPGGLVYGLANKPTAPNHMVFIGYVVVKQQNNGKVFIKVQNGFELEELHNVAVTGATNGQFLQYNSSSGLWIPSSSGNFSTLQVNGTAVPTGTGINSFVTTWDGTNSIGSSKLYHYYSSLDDQGYLSINGSGISSNTLSMFTPNAGETKLYMHSTYGGAYIVQAPNDPYNPGNLWWGISSVESNGNATTWIGSRGDNNALEKVSIYTKASGVIGNPIERFTVGVNGLVINDTSNNFDVRIEGDTDANLFFTDASVDRVGIGTSSPSYKLDVVGTGNFSQNLLVNGTGVSLSGHTHTSSNITDWNEAVDDRVNSLLVAGSGINLNYNDSNNTLTINLASSAVSGYEILSSGKSIFTVSQGYLSNNLNVYVNGSKLILGEDYTASNGSTFTLTQTAASGDIIEWQGLGGPAAYSELNHTHSSSDITNFNSSVSGLLPTIANSGDNRILTSTGSSVGINAEANLTFDGSLLNVVGSGSFSSQTVFASGTAAAPGISILGDTDTGIGQLSANGTNSLSIMTSGVERVTINSAGNVGIGSSADSASKLLIAGTFTSTSNNCLPLAVGGTIPSGATNSVQLFRSAVSTEASSFTIATLNHFFAAGPSLGAGSAIANQIAFRANSTLTGATNNYGFYSDIASGTGRWNFYANGTADNYFAGKVGIGSASTAATYGGLLRIGPMSSSSLLSDGGLEFVNAASSNGWGWRIANLDAGAGSVPLVFQNRSNSTSWSEILRITEGGNVGIGSTSPQTALQISKNADGALLILSGAQSANTQSILFRNPYHTNNSTAGTAFIGAQDTGSQGGNLIFATTSNNSGTSGIPTERMRIKSDGDIVLTNNKILADDSTTTNSVVYSFDGDTNTGIGRSGADAMTFITGGSTRATIDDAGQFLYNGRIVVRNGTTVGANDTIYVGPNDGALGRDSQIVLGCTFSNGWGGADYGTRFAGAIRFGANGGSADPRDWSMRFLVANGPAGSDTPRECMRISAAGNVGIGATTNLTALVNFPSADNGECINYYSASTVADRSGVGKYFTEVRHYIGANDFFAWRTGGPNGNERMKLSASLLTVGSSVSITASQVYSDIVGATNRDLFVDSTGKFGYVSSIRASKTNIAAIDDVSWLRNLTPVSFFYRRRNEDGTYSDEPDGTLDYGLIAEDVEVVAPELCFYDIVDDNPELRGVHYSKLITPMLKYIQQLEDRIASLETRLGDNV